MNKSERLSDMIMFLKDKSAFRLKDIMERFEISKSTALRDVQSLERMGLPIYSKQGRNGHYGILKNRLLSPILFTMDEVFALYFSMLTLEAYESTPFHLSVEQLKTKFETCISSDNISLLHRMEQVFCLGSIRHFNHCHFLKDILQYAIEEKVCEVVYRKKDMDRSYVVQFFDITSAYGQWYATGYNFGTHAPQVFRCDKVTELKESFLYQAKPLEEFQRKADHLYKKPGAIEFEVAISNKGADLFYKEHYPSMELFLENGQYMIRGFYNPGEESFIAHYLTSYGENIESIKPDALKKLMVEQLESLIRHLH
ncbi:transcriptional regulator [Lacrimispora xylanolytica]|jgi:predicted DNA-binding transcriptional regulator YafY|uniref:YafY family protein n=1 Tax=Lacrimispora xylanolytica TaxID=29375 RepID=A0ABY7A9U9_9FIRM|nr:MULTISPECIES: YafY family protein [Clostridia]MBS5958046.1 YafY family transcriptional regulator [Clostridiales bacterium]WAJ22302.1 YafY family protein [Lacrimispora xylanolytica]